MGAFRPALLARRGKDADSESVEAAHITWRPLGRVLVEQGLLTGDELERALAEQQTTGQRLGETIVKLGFVSGPELAAALASQYGIELMTEKGFGTGLRSEIQRRHESDRRRIVQLVPDPPTHLEAVPDEPETAPEADETPNGEAMLLAQLEEQWAKLAAAEAALAERERELAELAESRTHDSDKLEEQQSKLAATEAALTERQRELAELADHARELEAFAEAAAREKSQLEELNERLREQVEALRGAQAHVAWDEEEPPNPPSSHLVFVQLGERYELISRDGPPPERSTSLYLPDIDEGSFVVAGSRRSPLPGDARPCVFVQRG